MASEILRQLRDRYRNMKSGGGVLCVSALQLVVGLVLLGIYEGYKVHGRLTFRDNLLLNLCCQSCFNTKHLVTAVCKCRPGSLMTSTLQR